MIAFQNDMHSQWLRAAIALLDDEAFPPLEQARSDLVHAGIYARIQRHYEGFYFKKPKLELTSFGPPRQSDGRMFAVPSIFFLSDGRIIEAGIGRSSHDREPTYPIGDTQSSDIKLLVGKTIEKEVEAYHAELAHHRHLIVRPDAL